MFLLLHHLIVQPVWGAAPRALAWGALSGALAALAYRRTRAREDAFAHPLGALLLAAFAALALVPFAIAGWMRSRGAPDPFALLILGLLVTSFYHATQAAQKAASRWRRAELPVALALANALPAYVLWFAGDIHEDPPDYVTITMALAAVWLASGAALALVEKRWGEES